MITIENAPVEDWISVLKPYQRRHVQELLQAGKSPEETVEAWLSARGAESTIGFGGIRDPQPFLQRFRTEFTKFLCGDPAYDAERSKVLSTTGAAKTALISGISGAIALHVGTTATLLIPAVALMLHVVGKIGLQAWCSSGVQPSDGA